jgi:WD40 repeat protein
VSDNASDIVADHFMAHQQLLSLNPFPGLRAFRADEDYLFFGREEQTMELVQRLGHNRFVAVVGTSGSGKSSLVRCGLLSELLGGKMLGAGAAWEVAVTHPGGHPLGLLTEAILEADLYDREEENAREHLLATLSRSHFGLVEAVKQASLGEGTNFLLVVDQFEEIFRFHEAGQVQQEAANEFVSLLLEAVAQKDVPIYVVLTMRSDFIGECGQFEGLAEMVNRGEFLIPRLTREQYKRIIEGPIKVAGGEITPRLLQRLLNDIGQQQDQLPCLQHALMRTWAVWAEKGDSQALDLDDYQRVGRMAQALSLHADEIYDSLADDRQRELCRGMFQALTVQETENRGIRRPQRLSSLCQILEVKRDELVPIINAFRRPGVTFLMPSADVELTDQTIVDISHESLMRVWTRLRHWVEEEAQAAGIYRRLSESAALYHQGKAGLYRDPELGIALAWRESKRPNRAWAERYLPGFADAMAFLEASRQAAEEEEHAREAARQHELEQAQQLAEAQRQRLDQQHRAARRLRVMLGGLAGVAMVAVVACVIALRARANAKWHAQIAEMQATAAKENGERAGRAQQAAEAALADVERERVRAEQNLRKAEAAELAARRAEEESRRLLYTTDMKLAPFVWKDEEATADQLGTLLARHEPVGWDKRASASAGPPSEPVDGGPARPTQRVPGRLSHPTSVESTDKEDLRSFEWYYYRHLIEDAARVFRGHDASIIDSAVTPSGQLVTLDERWRLRRWDVETRAEDEAARFDLGQGRNVQTGALSPDGRFAALAIEKDVHLIDTTTGNDVLQIDSANVAIRRLAFSGDGGWLVILDGRLRWCDTKSGRAIASIDHTFGARCEGFALSPDCLTLVVAGTAASGRFFSTFRLDPDSKKVSLIAKEKGVGGTVADAAISPDGTLVALVSKLSGMVFVFDASSGTLLAYRLSAHSTHMAKVAFSGDGSQLATSDVQGTIKIWDAPRKLDAKSTAKVSLKGHSGAITRLHFLPGNQRLLSTSADTTARIWNTQQGGAAVHPLASAVAAWGQYSSDGLLIASAGDNLLRLWDATTGQLVRQLSVHDASAARSVAFSPDKRVLAVGLGANKAASYVTLWDIDNGHELARLAGGVDVPEIQPNYDYGIPTALAFSPDGKYLLAGFGSQMYISDSRAAWPLKVWDVVSRRLVRRLDGCLGFCRSIRFSPDGSLIVAGSDGGTATVWSTATWRRVRTFENPEQDPALGYRVVSDVAISPDRKTLAMASAGGSILFWDIASGDKMATLKGHASTVTSIAFTPDGRTLASAGVDETVRLWNVGTQRELMKLDYGGVRLRTVRRLAFSPDATRLLATSFSGSQSAFWSNSPPIWDDPPRAADSVQQLLDSGIDLQSRIRMLSENLRLHEALERLSKAPFAPRKDVLSRSERRQNDDPRVLAALAAARTNWHASQRRWNAAADEYQRFKQLGSDDLWDWLRTPGLLRVARALIEQDQLAEARTLLSGAAKRRIGDGAEAGLGVSFTAADGVVRTEEVTPGSPADRGGLRPGDVLLKINGFDAPTDPVTWLSWRQLNSQIGAKISFTVRHAASNEPEDVVLTSRAFFADEDDSLTELGAAIDRRLSAEPASPALLELRALIAGQRSDSDAQVADCTAAIEALAKQPPETASEDLKRLYRLRGDAYVAQSKWQQAVDDYARGHTDNAPDETRSNWARAEAEMRLGRAIETIVPTSEQEGLAWHYTTEKPADDWNKLEFDDSKWREGIAPFGTPSLQMRTHWSSPEIWLRRTFDGAPSADVKAIFLRLWVDDTAEIFLNGERLASRDSWTQDYVLVPLETSTRDRFVPGSNTLAVHCRNIQAGSFFDMGLFAAHVSTREIEKLFEAKTNRDPWLLLAMAYRLTDDPQALHKLVQHRPQAAGAIGDLIAGDADWSRAAEIYSVGISWGGLPRPSAETDGVGTPPHDSIFDLLSKRATAYEQLGRWDDAASDWRRAAEGNPDAANLLAQVAKRLAADGQLEMAADFHSQSRRLLEDDLQADPANLAVADALGKLLLDSNQASDWTVLKPLEAKSELGATFSILPDNSVLAGGPNPLHDRYHVTLSVPSDIDLAAVRLEALTHPSLPNKGPGRSDFGSFAQISWTVTASQTDGKPPITLEFDDAWADHQLTNFPIAPNGHWNIWGGHGGNCTAIWSLVNPIHLAAGTTLSFEMQCQNGTDTGENLGHFRLSLSSDQRTIKKQKAFATVTTGDPWARLAAGYALHGELDKAAQIAQRVLAEADTVAAKAKLLEAIAQSDELLTALAKTRAGDLDVELALAKRLADRGIVQAFQPDARQAGKADLLLAREIFARLHSEYRDPRWTVLKPTLTTSQGGATLTELEDSSLLVGGPSPAKEVYQIEARVEAGPISALRLEGLRHASLPGGGISRGYDGPVMLTEFEVEAASDAEPDDWHSVKFIRAWASDEQAENPVANAIDGAPSTPWATSGIEKNEDRAAIFVAERPFGDESGARLRIRLRQEYGANPQTFGRFRLSATGDAQALPAAVLRQADGDYRAALVALGKDYAQDGQTDESARAFAEALELAKDRAAKSDLIASAVPLEGVLEHLAENAPDDAEIQAGLARYYATRGESQLAAAARQKLIHLYEGALETDRLETQNVDVAQSLASSLVDSLRTKSDALDQQAQLAAVARISDPWLRLAASYVLSGEKEQAGKLLRKRGKKDIADQLDSGASLDAVMEELAFDPELQRLSQEIARRPTSTGAYYDRGRYLARLGRWRESADDLLRVREIDPQESMSWLVPAPSLVLAGNAEGYRKLCREMLQQFRGTSVVTEADRLCKVCLLLPGMVDVADLPAKRLRDATSDDSQAGYRPYFLGCCALISYREGNAREAVAWAARVGDGQTNPNPGALALTVRALAEYRLGSTDEARQKLALATALIPAELRTLGTDAYRGSLPVAEQTISHDWLIPEILRREASALIEGAAGE